VKSYKFYIPVYIFVVVTIIIILLFVSSISYKETIPTKIMSTEDEIEKKDNTEINVDINVSELNEEEQEIAKDLIGGLDGRYLKLQRSIRFTRNLSQYRNMTKPLLGFNRKKGEIYIKYTTRGNEMERTLCHELLHTYIFSNNETHEVVKDLAGKGVCYKNGGTT